LIATNPGKSSVEHQQLHVIGTTLLFKRRINRIGTSIELTFIVLVEKAFNRCQRRFKFLRNWPIHHSQTVGL